MDVRITVAFSNEMRITSSTRIPTTTNLSKCTKMTEGEHRIHGMNGVSDICGSNGNRSTNAATVATGTGTGGTLTVKEEKIETCVTDSAGTTATTTDTYSNLGGRLKFFKNGRFILELARAREGEKVAWVPVPKKTFWPPPGSTSSLSTYRQESSTSLSVSDDNSSIQSSPWQRDHTWKQTSPQRNISSNLNLYFIKTNNKNARKPCWQYKLQRCPYLIITDEEQRTKCSININSNNSSSNNTKCNNIKCIHNNININNVNSASAICLKKTLVHVVEYLWNKTLQTFNSITSPRKRILRELERVTIDDDLSIYNKRCRGKVIVNNQQKNSNNKNNNDHNNGVHNNGCEEKQPSSRSVITTTGTSFQSQQQPSSVGANKNCSYSITSLLGDENIKIEKPSSSSSNNTNTNSNSNSNNKSTVETLLKSNRDSTPSPSPSHYNYMSHQQFMSPYPIYSSVLHQHPTAPSVANYISPYYHHHHQQHQHQGAAAAVAAAAAAAAAYATATRPPSAFYQPLITQQPSIGPRHEPQYSPPWNTYDPHHLQASTLHRDDSSDVPLNLSKHAD